MLCQHSTRSGPDRVDLADTAILPRRSSEHVGAYEVPHTWFLILAALCIAGPYVLGVRPKARREWLLVAVTLAFLAWLLALMVPLRSR
jgi:hypothetical protein